MRTSIFTYGSLMFAKVWQSVVSGSYVAQAGILHDYQRFALKDQLYPGMVAQQGGRVDGVIYHDVSAADIDLLDAFEGAGYRRIEAEAHSAGGDPVVVHTYLALDPATLSAQPWLPHEFQLERFLATYCPTPPPAANSAADRAADHAAD